MVALACESWTYALLGCCLILGALAAYFHFRVPRERSTPAGSMSPGAVSTPSAGPMSSGPVRILAGYNGSPRTDSSGNVWSADRFFSGGGTWQRSTGVIARTSDPFIFEHSRTGDFSYSIPLKPGSYELHLFSLPRAKTYRLLMFRSKIGSCCWALMSTRSPGRRHCR